MASTTANPRMELTCARVRTQAAVVAATTFALANPAFAATVKLGGDNGELGFFVRALDATSARARDTATRR